MITKTLMISMDSSLLLSGANETKERHRDYAERLGDLKIVVCNRGHATGYTDGPLRVEPTNSRHPVAYLFDGIRAANRLTRDWKPEVIAAQDPMITGLIGARMRRKLGVPLIVQDHTTLAGEGGFATESLRNCLLMIPGREVFKGADVIRVLNHAERDALVHSGILADRVRVLPLRTNLNPFLTPKALPQWRSQFGLAPNAPLAVWIGRAVPVKNLPLLLSAFTEVVKALPEARLILAGDMRNSPYPALIDKLDLTAQVFLTGALGHDDLAALCQTANVFVLSSDYEGLGRVLLEAAAAGLPSVSTDTNGAKDAIRDGDTGLIVPRRDARALVAGMLALLCDPERARAMGQRAKVDVLARYDRERLTADWVNLLRDTAQAGMQKRGAKKATAL